MKLQLTTYEAGILVGMLEAAEGEAKTPSQKKLARAALLIRKRIEDLVKRAPKGARETRWAASIVASLAEHEDTCTQCRKTFRRCADDLDLHADLSLGCG